MNFRIILLLIIILAAFLLIFLDLNMKQTNTKKQIEYFGDQVRCQSCCNSLANKDKKTCRNTCIVNGTICPCCD